MKPLSELSHYEVLDIPREAGGPDVERAYRLAQATWSEDGLATYGLYEAGESDAIRERIELAYRVLSDEEAKHGYDAQLGGIELPPGIDLDLEFEPEEVPAAASARASEVAPEIEEFEDFEDPGEGEYDGSRLRRVRLARGIDLEKIADVTKISATYLGFIEEERFDDLPATVYVRGFVAAYARCVGLDPERVVGPYIERLASARPDPNRRRAGKRRR
jgi:transcriptional regulator with XRE-family HTH domain